MVTGAQSSLYCSTDLRRDVGDLRRGEVPFSEADEAELYKTHKKDRTPPDHMLGGSAHTRGTLP